MDCSISFNSDVETAGGGSGGAQGTGGGSPGAQGAEGESWDIGSLLLSGGREIFS